MRADDDAARREAARELGQPALEDYWADRIDEEELRRRKEAARQAAMAEHSPFSTLEAAFAAYTAAVAAREDAQKVYSTLEAAEDFAEAKLEAALQQLEKQTCPQSVEQIE